MTLQRPVACVQPPLPLKKILSDFFEGRGGCTQATSVLLLRLPIYVNAHLITLSDEKSGAMLRPQKRVSNKIKDNRVLCQLSVKPKANVSCQLNFRQFISCQLTPTPAIQMSVNFREYEELSISSLVFNNSL